MFFFLAIVIMILVVSFWWMFLSYNFTYDYAYVENLRKVQDYKLIKNNEKLFKHYFEDTTWKFNQLFWFLPENYKLNLWNYEFSWLTVYFTGYIFLNEHSIKVKPWDFLNYQGNYNITVQSLSTWWQYFFIDWFSWNFSCQSWVYLQKLSRFNLERKYIVFTSTGIDFNLLSWDFDQWWNPNDIKFSWSFSWNENILNKYIFDIYSWNILYQSLTWSVCSWLECVYTGYNFSTWSYEFILKIYLTWLLQNCWSLVSTGSVEIDY